MIPLVEWVATFRDRVRHAHVNGHRVCAPHVKEMGIEYWLKSKSKAQPFKYCKRCQDELRETLRGMAAGRAAFGSEAPAKHGKKRANNG